MTSATLFSGIGGPELAADELGWEHLFSCEINPFGRHILSDTWPKAINYEDIKTTDFSIYRGRIDVLTGGFPCQPYSLAGLRKGTEDDRHLWPEMLRAIRECQPRWVVGENVFGIINWNGGLVFEQVQTDLEAEGYEVQTFVLPAAGVGAPHKRERVWIIANSCGLGYSKNKSAEEKEQYDGGRPARCEPSQSGQSWDAAHSTSERLEERGAVSDWFKENQTIRGNIFEQSERPSEKRFVAHTNSDQRPKGRMYKEGCEEAERHVGSCDARSDAGRAWDNFPTQSPVRTGDDGFSTGTLRQRIREDSMGLLSEEDIDKIFSKAHSAWVKESIAAGGNAIVPQVILQIFKAIEMYEELQIELK